MFDTVVSSRNNSRRWRESDIRFETECTLHAITLCKGCRRFNPDGPVFIPGGICPKRELNCQVD